MYVDPNTPWQKVAMAMAAFVAVAGGAVLVLNWARPEFGDIPTWAAALMFSTGLIGFTLSHLSWRRAGVGGAPIQVSPLILIWIGGIVVVVAVVMTALSYFFASRVGGGPYLILWGPILFAGWLIVKGVMEWKDSGGAAGR